MKFLLRYNNSISALKNALFAGFDIFYPLTGNIVYTEDCCNVNK